MTEKYWKDYSEFIAKVEEITKLSPVSLLELYSDFVGSLETKNMDDFTLSEWKRDDDFNFRWLIQKIIDSPELVTNELKQEFQDKIVDLDKRIKIYISARSLERKEWYKGIELNPDKFK